MKELLEKIAKKKKAQEVFYKYKGKNRIGIKEPIRYTYIPDGPSLDLKLKPPKISPKSKKIYKDVFIRSLKKGTEHHLYSLQGIYIVSLYKSLDEVKKWIDERYETIKERVNEIIKS